MLLVFPQTRVSKTTHAQAQADAVDIPQQEAVEGFQALLATELLIFSCRSLLQPEAHILCITWINLKTDKDWMMHRSRQMLWTFPSRKLWRASRPCWPLGRC